MSQTWRCLRSLNASCSLFFHAEPKSLAEIVQDHKLPLKDVEFANAHVTFDIGDNKIHKFKKLKIARAYQELYFLANTVVQGKTF